MTDVSTTDGSRDRELEVLLELTQSLVSSLDIQEILYTVVSRVAQVVDVERVSIVLVPDDAHVGYVVAASDDAAVTNLRLDLDKYPEIVHVVQTREPLTIEDVSTHPVLDGVRGSVTDLGLSAITLVPIVWEDDALGVLFIRASSDRGALDAARLGFCQVLCNATAIALRNARILQWLRDETARDAEAREKAEERVRVLQRFEVMLSAVPEGITVFEPDGSVLFGNPHAHRVLGYEPGSLIGKSLWQLVPRSELRRAVELRDRLQAGDFPKDIDVRVLRRDGQAIILNGSFAPIGHESVALLCFRDVTGDRAAAEELVRTRNFLRGLIEESVDAIVAADMKGTIILFNKAAESLYARKADEVVGKLHVRNLYPGDGAREVKRLLKSKRHGGVGRLGPLRFEALNSKGDVFPISLTAAMILEDGKPTATFGIFTDLRERTRVEQELRKVQERLAVSEKQALLMELAGATAHELNQPLTSVMGYSELLARKTPNESPNHRAVNAIHQEAQRMAEIVRKIGKLTHYETKSYVGDQRILDLDRGVDEEPPAEPKDAS